MSSTKPYLPRLIAWEVTRQCNLHCQHCRAAAEPGPYAGELSTAECLRVLDNIATLTKPIVILTGGEPMMRDDIYDLAAHGDRLGMTMVLATCGQHLTADTARRLRRVGIRRISFSIDGATRSSHDAFRQVPGAFASVMQAISTAKEAGLEFQINTTITRHNVDELEQILGLAVSLGAVGFHPFLLVPTGRGAALADQEIAPEQYEQVLEWVYRKRLSVPIQFKPTCAPHYYRIVRQQERAAGRHVTQETHGMDAMTKGCMGGQSFAFISHVGKVQICGFLDIEAGDLRAADYDFARIWNSAPLFQEVRDVDAYHGRCGYCEYRMVCGGCRARAFAATGDPLAEEPYCVYEPQRQAPAVAAPQGHSAPAHAPR